MKRPILLQNICKEKEWGGSTVTKMFGITDERVRQLELRGLRKIRNSDQIVDFACYMDDEDTALETIDYIKTIDGNDIYKNKSYVRRSGGIRNKYKKDI